MIPFERYSNYYDLIYGDKDYERESEFVVDLIRQQSMTAKSLLEFGCGTGRHAIALARRGYTVAGIDLSSNMVQCARNRLANAQLPPEVGISFEQGDLRTLCSNQKFDAVLSLFHVMSYQTTDNDLLASFFSAAKHLKPGGIFIFDCWYGPGVLASPPMVRVKRMEDKSFRITRIAEPIIHQDDNVVDVRYEMFIEDRVSGNIQRLNENHRMRYLFEAEILEFMTQTGFVPVTFGEWLTARPAGPSTWSAYVIARTLG